MSRFGEANGVMASVKSMSSLLAYALTAGASEVLMTKGLNGAQWIFFAVASIVSACMLAFVSRISIQAKVGESAASKTDSSSIEGNAKARHGKDASNLVGPTTDSVSIDLE